MLESSNTSILKSMTDRLHSVQRLSNVSVCRYSRQLLVRQMGANGMLCLQSSRILVVGAGGLGCPAAMYLASAGIGTLGIVDYDTVDVSNLHRQIGHGEKFVGTRKTASLINCLRELNSTINYIAFETPLTSENALDIVKDFDVVIDASDNVPTRYLLNDACVLEHKPLVSGSALCWEGQLTVYNYSKSTKDTNLFAGPCYRCVFPRPPPPQAVTNCSDSGVIGPVTGVIGSLQALEAIKIIIGTARQDLIVGRLLLFDGFSGQFRDIRLRSRNPECAVCGDNPTVTKPINYEVFCASTMCDKTSPLSLLPHSERLNPMEFKSLLLRDPAITVVDIRPPQEFNLCHIPGAINIPFDSIESDLRNAIDLLSQEKEPYIFICRRGNNSQVAVHVLKQQGISAKDVVGGLAAWSSVEGVSFPTY